MSIQNTATAAIPQGDGDPRPFCHVRPTSPVRVHVEKSGPAFMPRGAELLPVSVADQLGLSLVAQTMKAAAEVINALDRSCFLDVMPAWNRLLVITDLHLPLARTYPRSPWEFAYMREAVMLAMLQCEEPHALLRWITANSMLRGYAMNAAMASESRLDSLADDPHFATIRENAAKHRAFGEGH